LEKLINAELLAVKDTFSKLVCKTECLSLAELKQAEILNKATLAVFTKEDVKRGGAIIQNWLGWNDENIVRQSWKRLCGGNDDADTSRDLQAMRVELLKIPNQNLKIPSTRLLTCSQDERWILISE